MCNYMERSKWICKNWTHMQTPSQRSIEWSHRLPETDTKFITSASIIHNQLLWGWTLKTMHNLSFSSIFTFYFTFCMFSSCTFCMFVALCWILASYKWVILCSVYMFVPFFSALNTHITCWEWDGAFKDVRECCVCLLMLAFMSGHAGVAAKDEHFTHTHTYTHMQWIHLFELPCCMCSVLLSYGGLGGGAQAVLVADRGQELLFVTADPQIETQVCVCLSSLFELRLTRAPAGLQMHHCEFTWSSWPSHTHTPVIIPAVYPWFHLPIITNASCHLFSRRSGFRCVIRLQASF